MKKWWHKFCDNNGELLLGLCLAAAIFLAIMTWRMGPVVLGGMWDGFKLMCEICLGWLQIIGQLFQAIMGG